MQILVSPLAATVLGALSSIFKPITTLNAGQKCNIMDRNLQVTLLKKKKSIFSSMCDKCSCSRDKMHVWGKGNGEARNKVCLKFLLPGFRILTSRKI